jgi:hypothetical protein
VPTRRITYDDLPARARTVVEDRIGEVTSTSSAPAGLNSAVAARLHTATSEAFIKALPADHPWVWTQQREAEIAPHLENVAPRLIERVVIDGWDILIFEALRGRHADYRSSTDLHLVAELLRRLSALPIPPEAMKSAEERLRDYVTSEDDLKYFAGGALLHTDWNHANVIIGEQAHLVDWGWATRGAPWLDTAYWVIWLIAAGHTPTQAETWAATTTAWQQAPHQGINAFAAANLRLWERIAGPQPDTFSAPMLSAASLWRQHRSSLRTDTSPGRASEST